MTNRRISDEECVKKDIEALYLGNLKTVEFDLPLPACGLNGTKISWESQDERFLSNEGKVHKPIYGMGNRELRLIGTFQKGDTVIVKSYQVTIIEQDSPYEKDEYYPIEISKTDRYTVHAKDGCADAKIRLLPGSEFYDVQERMHRYLHSVSDDQMLYHFRTASGLDTKDAVPLQGWEASESNIKGHTTGHYLSALALCYRACGDETIKEKAIYMVEELGKCQDAFSGMEGIKEGFLSGYSEEQFDLLEEYTPYPKIWAPYYTLHKIIAGLIDCYLYVQSKQALAIAEKIGMWTWNRLKRLPRTQLKKMWSMYIAGEFGGMNAVMVQLAQLTGRHDFIECAKLFDNDKLFLPLEKYQDRLSGMHANQHIPQVIGALELYKATGEERYLRIAKNFWQTVTENRCYASGGLGETEMFRGYRLIGGLLTTNTQESCASYNMLKLTKELYLLSSDVKYMNYYENTAYNHILATLDKEDNGESTYFLPLGPGMKRTFLHENSCCHGTGMESHFKYRDGIYHRKEDSLYINLYIPSELEMEDTFIRIECLSKYEQRYLITVKADKISRLYLRKPEWAGKVTLIGNGHTVKPESEQQGYLIIADDFAEEKEFELQFETGFSIVRTPDIPECGAVKYGPYLMAVLSAEQEFIKVSFAEDDIEEKMKLIQDDGDSLHFTCDMRTWIPMCEIKDEVYHTYVILR